MKKILMIILQLNFCFGGLLAAETDHQFLNVCGCIFNCVAVNSGTFSANINADTGALSNSINPTFCMTTNYNQPQNLTLSASLSRQGGSENAIFNIGTTKYIILSNSSSLPTAAAITNIKGGSPSAASNSNAIAYQIQDPTTIGTSVLEVAYNTTNKNWDLRLKRRSQTYTTVNIPAASPLANTYSFDDDAGGYQATITFSFNS